MDSRHFDRLARSLCRTDTRRGIARLLAALPLSVALTALLGDDHASSHRRRRRKARHRHQTGNNKEHRKGKRKKKPCIQAGRSPGKGKPCCKGLARDTAGLCATGCICNRRACHATIGAAIAAARRGDTIRICAGVFDELIAIDSDLNLIGAVDEHGEAATTLDGAGAGSVVTIQADPGTKMAVTMQNLRITGGAARFGGGIQNGTGDPSVGATLTLTNCIVTKNAGGIFGGGGIFNLEGSLTLDASDVTENTVTGVGGGIYNFFGAVTLQNGSSITLNEAVAGGGLYNDNGTVDAPGGSITDNTPDQCKGCA